MSCFPISYSTSLLEINSFSISGWSLFCLFNNKTFYSRYRIQSLQKFYIKLKVLFFCLRASLVQMRICYHMSLHNTIFDFPFSTSFVQFIACFGVVFLISYVCDSFRVLDLWIYIFHQTWRLFSPYFFKSFFCPLSTFSSHLGIPMTHMLGHIYVVPKLSCFIHFFPLCI